MKLFFILKKFSSLIISSRQIIDDLFDFEEDLKRGNKNYTIAKFLKNEIIQISSDEELYKSIMHTSFKFSEIDVVINDATIYLDKAEKSIATLKIPLLYEIIQDFRIYINSIKAKLNQKKVEAFFINEHNNQS